MARYTRRLYEPVPIKGMRNRKYLLPVPSTSPWPLKWVGMMSGRQFQYKRGNNQVAIISPKVKKNSSSQNGFSLSFFMPALVVKKKTAFKGGPDLIYKNKII